MKSSQVNSVDTENNDQISSQEKETKIPTSQNSDEEQTKTDKETEKRLRKKLRYLQRAIQEDIYKMDVVQPNNKEVEIIPVRKKKVYSILIFSLLF